MSVLFPIVPLRMCATDDKTVLYCGMTATNGPEMFECMDAALNSGAQGHCRIYGGRLALVQGKEPVQNLYGQRTGGARG